MILYCLKDKAQILDKASKILHHLTWPFRAGPHISEWAMQILLLIQIPFLDSKPSALLATQAVCCFL